MKTQLFTLFLLASLTNVFAQKESKFRNDECHLKNISVKNMDVRSQLYSYFTDDDRSGIIYLNPISFTDIGGWEKLTEYLSKDPNITYFLENTTRSKLYNGYYYRYQQLYKGIPVEGGGFTILVDTDDPSALIGPPCPGCPIVGPTDPCLTFSTIAPHIYEGIDIKLTSEIKKELIVKYIEGDVIRINSIDISVVNNISGDCQYKLVYKVRYKDENKGDLISWIDANTGDILYNTTQHNNKTAPTQDWGTQFLNDQIVGGNTILSNDRLSIHDMTDLNAASTGQLGDFFDNNQIPTSPITREWLPADASPNVFQAFWMTDQVIDVYASALGINFTDVHIGVHPTAFGATSFFPGIPSDRSDFVFGQLGGNSAVEYDVIGHELGHSVVRQWIQSTQIEGGSLHEGIADMFGVYIESKLGGLDWALGDKIPFVVRNLETTSRNCFTDISNLGSVHDRSEALGHWFFLCVNGNSSSNIPGMSIDRVMQLVYESMPNLGSNPDYPDLMASTIDLTKDIYGICSPEFATINNAWMKICVDTDYGAVNTEPCSFSISGSTTVCEEDDFANFCIEGGLPNGNFNWTIIGKKSTEYTSSFGMQGNSQTGSDCLRLIDFPKYPFYPQYITIRVYSPQSGTDYIVKKTVKLVDCNHDDPSCDEYYDINGLTVDEDPNTFDKADDELILNKKDVQSDFIELIIYDLFGRVIDLSRDQLINEFDGIPQIVILSYWDAKGKLVKTEKLFVQ